MGLYPTEKRGEVRREIAFENKIKQEREQLNRELGRNVGQRRQGIGRLFPFHDDVFLNTREYTQSDVFPFKNELF